MWDCGLIMTGERLGGSVFQWRIDNSINPPLADSQSLRWTVCTKWPTTQILIRVHSHYCCTEVLDLLGNRPRVRPRRCANRDLRRHVEAQEPSSNNGHTALILISECNAEAEKELLAKGSEGKRDKTLESYEQCIIRYGTGTKF
jgi:hypothetical protein